MARSRRTVRVRKPRFVDSAAWKEAQRQAGRDIREFNRLGRALIQQTERDLREQERERANREKTEQRKYLKARRDALRYLRKTGLFEPSRSAYRIISTKRGPRRLVKKSYLLRSPKLKQAIADNPEASQAAQMAARITEYRKKLDDIYGSAAGDAFATWPIDRQIEILREVDELHAEYVANNHMPLGRRFNILYAYH